MTVRGWLSVHKNDLVMVIAGKDKGKRGKVLSVVPETSAVVVERINIVKRHARPGGEDPARRDCREGGPSPRLQRDGRLLQV